MSHEAANEFEFADEDGNPHSLTATHCNALQRTATYCKKARSLTATHCNTLQHTATNCNTQRDVSGGSQRIRKRQWQPATYSALTRCHVVRAQV